MLYTQSIIQVYLNYTLSSREVLMYNGRRMYRMKNNVFSDGLATVRGDFVSGGINMIPCIARYELSVFGDGSIQLTRLTEGGEITTAPVIDAVQRDMDRQPTKRIIQIMDVLITTDNIVQNSLGWDQVTESSLNRIVNRAFEQVADKYKVASQTVADKALRQLDFTKSELVNAILEFFQGTYTKETYKESLLFIHIDNVIKVFPADQIYVDEILQKIYCHE